MKKPGLDEEAFSRLLEGAAAPRSLEERHMATLVSALERSRPQAGPRPAFAQALREQLLAEAKVIAEAEKAARIPVRERVLAAIRARNEAWRRSFRVVGAAGLAAIMMLGSGAALASSRSALPNRWDYGLKRAQEGARLTVARGALARGYVQLELARTRLGEVKGLAVAGVRDQSLYRSTLNDMDASTIEASALLVEASRKGAGLKPLNRLGSFAIAQRLRLESIVDRVPAGVRPVARDSIATLVKLTDRVNAIVAGCDCPANVLVAPASAQGAGDEQPVGCACEQGGSGSSGSRGGSSDGGSNGKPSGGTGGDTSKPGDKGGTDVLPGSQFDDPVNDVVDDAKDILDNLGLPTVAPSPAPSIPGL